VKPRRVAKIKVVNEKGEIYDKDQSSSPTRAGPPAHFQPAPIARNQHEQMFANARLKWKRSRTPRASSPTSKSPRRMPITRR
jgi:hypothetical protein